mgnify:CR=1 FL=1
MMTREARQEAKGPMARRERETKKATGGETWLRAAEAAEHLRVSIPTLYRWTRDGTLTAYHAGGARLYRLRDLDALPRRQEGPCNA